MRFLLLTQYFPPEVGAAQTRLAALVQELKNLGHEVEVVTAAPNYPEGKIYPGFGGFYQRGDWEGTTVHRFWIFASQGRTLFRLLNYLSFAFTACFSIFVVQKPDWIFVNSGPLFVSIPGRLLSLRFGRPVIFNVSDLWPRSVEHLQGMGGRLFVRLAEKLEAWAYRTSTYVNAITDGVKDVLLKEKKLSPEKVLFLPNGVDTDLFCPGRAPQTFRRDRGWDDRFTLIYPGNHGYAHALDSVLEAAKILQDKNVPAFFLFVGGGSEKKNLQQKAFQLKLQNVRFQDPVPPAELALWIDAADLGLIHVRNSPLAGETRPAKMFPLMSAAKGILYAGFGEGSELLKKSGGGRTVPCENPTALALAVEEILQNPDQVKTWGANNRLFAQKNFETKVLIREWLRCLK